MKISFFSTQVAFAVSSLVYLVCVYTIKSMVSSNLDINAGSGVAE